MERALRWLDSLDHAFMAVRMAFRAAGPVRSTGWSCAILLASAALIALILAV